jgi:hypothetical protein
MSQELEYPHNASLIWLHAINIIEVELLNLLLASSDRKCSALPGIDFI